MIKRLLALLVVVVMSVSLLAGCGGGGSTSQGTTAAGTTAAPAEGGEIVIGTIQPISGQISVFGTQSRDAVLMAVEEINKNGGVLGKQVKVVVEDDEATPEKTVNAFKKLITQDKIVGLIGALTSNCSLAIASEAQARQIVMISPTSTNDTVTDAGDFIFRACYNDSFQGQVVAQFASADLKAKNAAVLFDNSNDYSKGLKENFKAKFEELGGKVVSEESYATGDKDFAAQITKIKGTNPDVIFLPDYYNTVSLIAKQVKNAGINVPMLGADGWDEIAKNAGDEVVGSYYSNHYSPEADDAEVKAFVAAYMEKYKTEVAPNALAALAYDATYILCDAIERAGSTDPAAIKAAVAATDKKFVTGQIKFNEKRNPVKSAVMVKLEAGDQPNKPVVKYAATVNP